MRYKDITDKYNNPKKYKIKNKNIILMMMETNIMLIINM